MIFSVCRFNQAVQTTFLRDTVDLSTDRMANVALQIPAGMSIEGGCVKQQYSVPLSRKASGSKHRWTSTSHLQR
jgi:hypothetical protein